MSKLQPAACDRLPEVQDLAERLQAIVAAIPDQLFLVDESGSYFEVLRDLDLSGAGETSSTPRELQDVLPSEAAERLLLAVRTALAGGESQLIEYSQLSQEGRASVYEVRIVPTGYRLEGRPAAVCLSRDVTLENHSLQSARLLETVISAAREGVVILNGAKKVLYANPSAGRITGYPPQELTESGEGFLRHQHDQELCQGICFEARKGSHWQEELQIHTKRGEERSVWLNIDTLRDAGGEIEYYVALLNDVTDIHRSRAELEHVATHDALTGLPNRSLFECRLDQVLSRARRQESIGGLLLLDLDRFKRINDSLGHSVGDKLLVEVAQRLQRAVRMEDTVARLGGDEFTVVLEDLDSISQAGRVAEKIIEVFAQPMMIEGLELDVTTSVGIATFPARDESIEDLLKQADAAMYQAKEAGGNQYRYHSPELSESAMSNIALQAALRSALSNFELQVMYQPQFDIDGKHLRGLEALLRWPGQPNQAGGPEAFIEVAEVSGLIEPLGMWVLEEVCRQAVAWRAQGLDYKRLSVNVSGRQLVNPGFAAQVAQLLERYQLPGSDLEIEITESTVIHEGDMRHRNLHELHAQGIRLAIDDFGTGHSSLVNLKRFPLRRLKIDRSFILDVGSDPNDEAIVGATIALAKQLGLEVIAEGVETEHQLAFLRALHCDLVQGYLFAEPMSALQVSQRFLEDA